MFGIKRVIPSLFIIVPWLVFGNGGFIPTPRDTGPAPEISLYNPTLEDGFTQVYQDEFLQIHYRVDRGLLAIRDLRNDYLWKTGLDIPFNTDIQDLVFAGANPLGLPPLEERLNTTFIGIANSLITIEYYDNANNIRRIGSSAQQNVDRHFQIINQNPWTAEVQIGFHEVDISVDLEISVQDDELIFRIPDEGLSGTGLNRLASINITPFLGASGGRQIEWNPDTGEYDIRVPKSAPPGYVVVPDGSGALIRFTDNSTRLTEYRGQVYGQDMSQAELYYSFADFSPPTKQNSMPLFGIVHGRNQNGFAAYGVSGDEYMEIVTFPEENTTFYTHAYPRFVYNRLYYQIYNQRGDGYFRLLEDRNRFDIEMRYRFLQGGSGIPDNSDSPALFHSRKNFPADYTGIALAYRDYLINQGLLPAGIHKTLPNGDTIPLRIDFLMADTQKSIVGHAHRVTTTIEDVQNIVEDLMEQGIQNLSVGLMGYARGGTVLSSPGRVRVLSSLGTKGDFVRILDSLRTQGVDVSFSRDFNRISQGQALLWGNGIRGASGWYLEFWGNQANAPVNLFYFAGATTTVQWLTREVAEMEDLGASSVSIDGMGYRLFSDYPSGKRISREDVLNTYTQSLEELSSRIQLNLHQPNQYLWKYTSRFLDTPVFPTQYLIQTDSIPLLQLVLQGSIQMFAPYSNFSFSSTQDVLRMIDYNVYPSFVITRESSHELLMTNSAGLYSTQYSNYRDLILDIYTRVNQSLKHVLGAEWIARNVLSPGIVLNQYNNGVSILVNYSPSEFLFNGYNVQPESARVFLGSGGVQ